MKRIDRLLIGALVLGVWVLAAMQFFGGMTAATPQRIEVNWPKSGFCHPSVTLWPLYARRVRRILGMATSPGTAGSVRGCRGRMLRPAASPATGPRCRPRCRALSWTC